MDKNTKQNIKMIIVILLFLMTAILSFWLGWELNNQYVCSLEETIVHSKKHCLKYNLMVSEN